MYWYKVVTSDAVVEDDKRTFCLPASLLYAFAITHTLIVHLYIQKFRRNLTSSSSPSSMVLLRKIIFVLLHSLIADLPSSRKGR